MIRGVRETATLVRQWLSLLSVVPTLVLARLEFVSGVSGRTWRNALVSVLVGLVAMVGTVVVLRGVE